VSEQKRPMNVRAASPMCRSALAHASVMAAGRKELLAVAKRACQLTMSAREGA
jgi:hypothetical protein